MIRALFSFALTLGLIAAVALWAVRSLDPAALLQGAPPPVSRTVELVAAEITQHLRREPIVEPKPPPAPIVATSSADDTERFELGEIGVGEAQGSATDIAEVPGDGAELVADHGEPVDPGEALADSALLVRRMLGLYDRALDPQ